MRTLLQRLALVWFLTPVLWAEDLSAQLPDSLAPDVVLPVQDFNFWIGEWDVNLRTRQDDGSWPDTYVANARIYPVLGRKAILELWDEPNIKGFSIRYYDPAQAAWMLWLNWPGRNRSGSSSLQGNFRHGRGEFFSTFTNAAGNEVISRYAFSDITPTSLRWDDAYSSDDGATWSHQWIMEFTRTANAPRLGGDGGPEHTFETGGRCDLPQYRRYEFLSGPWVGTITDTRERPGAVTGYRILDGCAVLLFAGRTGRPETANRFAHLTWNTARERFELLSLAADSLAPASLMFGDTTESGFAFYDAEDMNAALRRARIERGDDNVVLWIEEHRATGSWTVTWQARVQPFVPGNRD